MSVCRRLAGAILALTLALALALLSGCVSSVTTDASDLHILATTYPVYLFTTAVVGDTEGVEVDLLVNSQTSCLHDYTLTVKDMKAIDQADVIIMNGAGLEDFMSDALAQSNAFVIDCSEEVTLLPTEEHEGHNGHDHEEEYDPHFWMDPHRAGQMAEYIANGLAAFQENSTETYRSNAAAVWNALSLIDPVCRDTVYPAYPLITFHDGFQYFAEAQGFDLLKTIEEEEGATASAAEIKEIAALIEENHIPAIFVEKNGSRKTADVIARETGCKVYELDMLMSGDGEGIQPYIDALDGNLTTILEAFS